MAFVSKVRLSLQAVAILSSVASPSAGDQAPLCGGRRYAISGFATGLRPVIELTVDGVSGPFLLDYGATRSSLSADAFGAAEGSVKKAAISLPSFEEGSFPLKHYDSALPSGQRQLGVIGTDFLSLVSVQLTASAAFISSQTCPSNTLRAADLIPIAQTGFFSSQPSAVESAFPNVPVVFLRLGEVRTWAQIDTGYADTVYPHSVDINEALYERLVESGVRLERLGDVSVRTCEGRESRRVYSVKECALVIENEKVEQIARTASFHLIVKSANGCGGIGAMATPAAQLGASFLQLFGTVVFDPKSQTVWLEGGRSPTVTGCETP
jgi:hypothetical protein